MSQWSSLDSKGGDCTAMSPGRRDCWGPWEAAPHGERGAEPGPLLLFLLQGGTSHTRSPLLPDPPSAGSRRAVQPRVQEKWDRAWPGSPRRAQTLCSRTSPRRSSVLSLGTKIPVVHSNPGLRVWKQIQSLTGEMISASTKPVPPRRQQAQPR